MEAPLSIDLRSMLCTTDSALLTLVQDEMLGSVKDSGGAEWSVLVMDDVTTRVMSHSCRISDVLDFGVSCELSSPSVALQQAAAILDARLDPQLGYNWDCSLWACSILHAFPRLPPKDSLLPGLISQQRRMAEHGRKPFFLVGFLGPGSHTSNKVAQSHTCHQSASSLAFLSPKWIEGVQYWFMSLGWNSIPLPLKVCMFWG